MGRRMGSREYAVRKDGKPFCPQWWLVYISVCLVHHAVPMLANGGPHVHVRPSACTPFPLPLN